MFSLSISTLLVLLLALLSAFAVATSMFEVGPSRARAGSPDTVSLAHIALTLNSSPLTSLTSAIVRRAQIASGNFLRIPQTIPASYPVPIGQPSRDIASPPLVPVVAVWTFLSAKSRRALAPRGPKSPNGCGVLLVQRWCVGSIAGALMDRKWHHRISQPKRVGGLHTA